MLKAIYLFVIAIFLIFIQQSLLNTFNFFSDLNLLLVVLVFIAIVFGSNFSFVWAGIIGLLLSFFSVFPLGTLIVIYLTIVLVINILYKQVLTNLSFYTGLILMIIATSLYNFLVVLLAYIFYQLNLIHFFVALDGNFLKSFIAQVLLNLSAIALIFMIARFTYKKLNLAFIAKHE